MARRRPSNTLAWRPLRVLLSLAMFCLLFAGQFPVDAKKSKLVREIRSFREYQALLEHHKTKTGLGVIVDFYSDSCGPCRQIAPLYKDLAKQYKGKVVFAKVNVQTAHDVSSRMGIRSMPTFHFYHLGKKKQEFSGGNAQALQQYARSLSSAGANFQVEIKEEDLVDFYAEHDPTKTAEDVTALLDKHEPRMYVPAKIVTTMAIMCLKFSVKFHVPPVMMFDFYVLKQWSLQTGQTTGKEVWEKSQDCGVQ